MTELVRICQRIKDAGGQAFLVGGAVRDMVLGLEPKDLDVEVFGLSAKSLEDILNTFGKVDAVGRAFGILKLTTETEDFDFSLPRRDNKVGQGHKGFIVEVDKDMSIEEAASRRDFTMNSVSFEPIEEKLIDFWFGLEDLDDRLLVATSEHFSEDALRVLRGMQFAARFEMKMHQKTAIACHQMIDEFEFLSKERIWGEWEKWALKGRKPSMGLEVLDDAGWLFHFPEIEELIDLPQTPFWHPEGDVWEHTCQAVDFAVTLCDREGIENSDRLVMVFAALCHDMGKPATTEILSDKIITHGHDKAGEAPTRSFMARIGAPAWLVERVVPLVTNHMVRRRGLQTRRAVRRLADRLAPASIQELMWLVEIDGSSRHPAPPFVSWSIDIILNLAEQEKCKEGAVESILMGRHLIEIGMKPGPAFGRILAEAREAQLDGEFSDLEGAKKWLTQSTN